MPCGVQSASYPHCLILDFLSFQIRYNYYPVVSFYFWIVNMSEFSQRNLNHERNRIRMMLRRYLVHKMSSSDQILSVGCGMGSDVIELREMGFNAYGLDPSRLLLDDVPSEWRAYFRVGSVEDLPFADKKFDFIYALDVIEHVGCFKFGTIIMDDTLEVRKKFMAACLSCLSPNGVLLLTTSNKLCPVDVGHWHKYHWLGRILNGRSKFGISLPWSRKNFLMSYRDVRRLVALSDASGKYRVECEPAALYPSLSERRGLAARIAFTLLRVLDLRPFIGSAFAPLLVLRITKGD